LIRTRYPVETFGRITSENRLVKQGDLVNDYGTLAERLRCSGHAEEVSGQDLDRHKLDPVGFFDEVKAHIINEIEKANAELRKRRLDRIERVLVPCFRGKLCLTFGTVVMCCVDLDEAQGQIYSVVYGPPNRWELSRKVYRVNPAGDSERVIPGVSSHFDPTAATLGPQAVANDIVSEILETGIRLTQRRIHRIESSPTNQDGLHFAEFWISFASLLRGYTALHGTDGHLRAELESTGSTITVRVAEKRLLLKRHHAFVTWTRENGDNGVLEFTDHGTLRSNQSDEPMDIVAERWARELMFRPPLM
jgi:hypothetical protein